MGSLPVALVDGRFEGFTEAFDIVGNSIFALGTGDDPHRLKCSIGATRFGFGNTASRLMTGDIHGRPIVRSPPMKLHAPAAARNREVIATVLKTLLPASGRLLEVASGSGEHAVYFAGQFPGIEYQPSDLDERARRSIAAHIAESGLVNALPPLSIDAEAKEWSLGELDAVLNINMIHVSPWSACVGLLERAAAALKPGGVLFLYGPYFQEGVETALSNISFDKSLRQRDPQWGVRRLDAVIAEATARGLHHDCTIAMPANNLSVAFRKA